MSKLDNQRLFKNFTEYWHFAKELDDEHRRVIYKSLPQDEMNRIRQSYKKGKWEDVFARNEIDSFLDDVKEKFGYDLVSLRSQVLRGKSVYIPRIVWDYALSELKEADAPSKQLVIGGIHGVVCKENEEIILLLPLGKEE